MKKLSLRLRLIIFFSLISCLIWTIAAIISWQETKEKTDEFFDTYQMILARRLAAADWSHVSPDLQHITDRLIDNIKGADEEDEAVGFAVFDRSGKIIFHDNENGRYFHFDNQALGRFVNRRIDDEDWRIVFLQSADGQFMIAVGQELEYRNGIAWDMSEKFMAPWGCGLFALLLLMILLITAEFYPLRRLVKDMNLRRGDDLSPLAEDSIPQEVLPLIRAFNHRLAEAGTLLHRERSFIADSAHELRSPLTALKVQLEVARLSADDQNTLNNALQNLEAGIERSSRLVEQLLALSRIDSSLPEEIGKTYLNWPQIINELVDEYRSAADTKNISFSRTLEGNPPFTEGNSVLCALMIRNLIDNAVKYSPQCAQITIKLENHTLTIANSHSSVPPKYLGRLGERFFRPAGQKENGSGLGLSIVTRIAAYYGCNVSFANIGKDFMVTIKKE